MRHVVVHESLDELDVHPPGPYQNLVEVCVASAAEMLHERERFVETTCPACGSADREEAFRRHGYTYWSCRACVTLYVSPRPSAAQIEWYVLHSPVVAFRSSDEYRQATGQHAQELAYYRAEWVAELCDRVGTGVRGPVVDVETRSPHYLVQLGKRRLSPIVSVKPLFSPAGALAEEPSSYSVVANLQELAGSGAALVAVFDVLEHQASPRELVAAAHEALMPGGILVITTRSSSGFDIQVLWDQCTTTFPAEHLNLISVEGMRALLAGAGFEIREASTPGQLDVQMIERTIRERPEVEVPRFLRYFLTQRDRLARQRLQQFLQQNLLSSHLRVVARKTPGKQRAL